MDVNKAKEAAKVMNRIEKCESFLKSLEGLETCELEEGALQILILIKYYEDELAKLNKELNNL